MREVKQTKNDFVEYNSKYKPMVSGGTRASTGKKGERMLPCLAVISDLVLVFPLRNMMFLGLEYTIN